MSDDNVIPLHKPRPLSEYRGVTFPKYGDGPITFPNRDVLREYLAEQKASVLLEAAEDIRRFREGEFLMPEGMTHYPYSKGFESWLTDRADALIAPDPRESKG